ncbi:LmbU family transcriptional regulator [Nonomuraea jiangxiensis]|uniref:LmbU family transcriptional regulator n=1 Tax=Nonomuraea jiangxiensis TaxID=633440 RepID=UPI000B877CD5|nr:LmbU family transcriptional regulator [Nonomuraea jiangxiensis]
MHLPERISLEGWQRIGEQISLISDASTWWLGDWLVYGQNSFPERYRQAMERSSLDYQTLRNYAWIARKVEPSRRHGRLSIQHHAEVAALPADEQTGWLDQAERGGWSRNELRRRVRASRRDLPADTEATGLFHLKVSQAQRRLWEAAADQAAQSLADWVTSVLDEAAQQQKGSAGSR